MQQFKGERAGLNLRGGAGERSGWVSWGAIGRRGAGLGCAVSDGAWNGWVLASGVGGINKGVEGGQDVSQSLPVTITSTLSLHVSSP